jgi:uncharacterized protein with NAD-binding domain and iron-sulfur cluster
MTSQPTKVAIIGGGPAGVTAAFELTATVELRSRYEVTVYQPGWRLGGKGASGRNAKIYDRIEEHGLHVWFGCYENAFSLMRRCYQERGAQDGAPLATWQDAFKPCDEQVIYERFRGRWVGHGVVMPRTPFEPGDQSEHTPLQALASALAELEGRWGDLGPQLGILATRALGKPFLRAARAAEEAAEGGSSAVAKAKARGAERLARAAAAALRATRDSAYRRVVEPRVENDRLRYAFTSFDLVATVVCGIAADELVRRGWGVIDDEELIPWLRRHGATELTIETSPFLRAIYDGSFAYEEGDKSRPSMAAGKAMQDYLRGLLTYKGAFMYKMQAGMGDTVFAPLYEVLLWRGVKFEFFTAATELHVSADEPAIASIEIVKQVALKGGKYDPLCTVKDLSCWPSDPHWDQVKGGDPLEGHPHRLERELNPLGRKPTTLRRGEDFDEVVLAVPPDVQKLICREMIGDDRTPAYTALIENSHSVMTQAFQLWINRTDEALGWRYQDGSLMSCYVEPLDTYCCMTQLIPRENWPESDDMLDIAYFCGVLGHEGVATQQAADEAATREVTEYLERDVGDFWPDTDSENRFNWSVLADPENREGAERLNSQLIRANFAATERYVLSLPGTIKYRLWPDQSGYSNLVLAGDWTRNGIDAGSVESAVTSGMLAAQAITGQAKRVAGLTGWLGADLDDPAAWRGAEPQARGDAAARAAKLAGRFPSATDGGVPAR